ncbi:c-type cytochrome [Cobetia crustatorum]|uniref:Cytochrome c n=1 Tax=Cobetia crustatorum TaxID=553385 RepID=A0A558HEE2_9GAMM|nr:cytochrome c [Cobetia crustatorum]TVU67510.1 cytochrome c [Cobetia crustatorum]
MKKVLITASLTLSLFAAIGAGGVYSGVINVGADSPHEGWVYALLDTARTRSVERYASDIEIPDLQGEALITAGAGNYAAMCTSCHLAPGMSETELSQGLYPQPPNFWQTGVNDNPAENFWIIKHGIKASGMPAWGKSMQDDYIWQMVAFMDELPGMSPQRYQTLVASSAGHQHGEGETSSDHHASNAGDSHHEAMTDTVRQAQDTDSVGISADGHDETTNEAHHEEVADVASAQENAAVGSEGHHDEAPARDLHSQEPHEHANGH